MAAISLKRVFGGILCFFLILIVVIVLQSSSHYPHATLTLTENSDYPTVTDSWKTADSTVPVLKTVDTTVPVLKTADSTVSVLKTADSTVSVLKTADGTVPVLKTADGTVSVLKTADSTVPVLKTVDTTVPVLKTADSTVSVLKTAGSTVPVLKTAGSTVPVLKTADTAEGGVVPEATVSPIQPARNPGCDTHRLSDFKPIQNGYTYHHPDVVHYMWSSDKPGSEFHLTFTQYVSVLSVHTFLGPREIVLHTNTKPAGNFWKKLEKKTNVRAVIVNISRNIGNKPAAGVEHAVDYYKLKHVLLKVGGIVMDFDIVILNGKKLREMLAASECYLGCEQHCTLLNIGFVGCIKNSSFVAEWVHGYETDYRSRDWHVWLYNSGVYPAEILTRKYHCYNLWVDEEIAMYPDMWTKREWLERNRVDWKRKTVAHHFLATLVKIDRHVTEDEYYRTSESPLAKMIRYVLEASS